MNLLMIIGRTSGSLTPAPAVAIIRLTLGIFMEEMIHFVQN
jgi:hypothetical protein